MDSNCNFLFGVVALEVGLLDARQFVEACALWTTRKDVLLADLLIERGWIEPADRSHVEYLVGRKLHKHKADSRTSLVAIDNEIKRSLAALDDPDLQRSVTGPPVAEVPPPDATVDFGAESSCRYTLTRVHATGGIGRVWLARDRELGRDVALKELRPEGAANPALSTRFLREARITGQLEHPGVVPVYELARHPASGQPFYTMRFVKGRTLTEAAGTYHRKRGAGAADSLEFLTLLNAFVAVCNTVAYAHARGVIHRDLKGQNVVLGDFGEVVVLDWGLAKLVDRPENEADAPLVALDTSGSEQADLTVQGQTVGTPAYMAPEQAAGRPDLIDRRTDVYGLGTMLYEVLTGQPPFTGANTLEVLRRVREEEPAPPRVAWPDVPLALEAVCLKALTKRPTDRPASASELGQEVQQWQEVQRRQAAEALRASEALYHSLVETLPLGLYRKDLQSRFIFGNRRFCDGLGKTLDQILGKTDFDFFPAPLAEKYQRDDMLVHRTGKPYATAEDHVTAQGQKLFVEVVKSPIFDAVGQVIGTQGIFWDVTERNRTEDELRKSRERFELAVLGSQDGLWDWNLETGAIYLSPRYKNLLGFEDDEFPNRLEEWHKRLHPEDRERVAAALEAHLDGRTPHYESEHRLLHTDGSYRWVRSRGVAVRDEASGKPYRMVGSHEDITARKQAEDALRDAAAELALLRLQIQQGTASPQHSGLP
jgi:PAS domain S-box-containing protein